ncbi:MAG: Glu/Leu/Phe/Val family dehydrogenase [Alphaproteobacteria bacterium]
MAQDMFRFADDLGPDKIIHFTKPSVGLKGIVVVDNVAAGPAIGGTRMGPDVSVEECFRLARAMTFKNAAAGLPHGGAKAVIFADPAMPAEEKERTVRAYACAIREITDYIPGPDMGTDETAMAWVRDEIGRSVGLPREIGGIPLDEIGATGFGLAVAAEVAQDFCDVTLEGARVAIQGFGAVGKHTAKFLTERGALLVGASDSHGATVNPDGIDVDGLIAHKNAGKPVGDYAGGKKLGRDDIISLPCDIWVPAARPDVLRKDNVDQLDCKMVLQGANIPATLEAEARLHERGILCVPDFIANAGGVICGSVEYHGGTQSGALAAIEEKLRFNTHEVLQAARDEKLKPREAAVRLAEKRVRRAMALTRWG